MSDIVRNEFLQSTTTKWRTHGKSVVSVDSCRVELAVSQVNSVSILNQDRIDVPDSAKVFTQWRL
jgi:hypothetical protein